ncbi:U4/U6.U5 tri-snRNP-associated protein snu66 [Escovopsis weberi]|uniref:U4/U6.U5 tri-snRNP-associated protein snu66 n=1 Tax=Escovopsis weberi TaxID=150374 RepID=A0A0M8N1K3_ESCWE|nr:U4/U6.U5 tri-snRNP-associated protein snu66 [Escovopsis weberi]
MDAATIEETNRIRISLGMKPLPVPGATDAKEQSKPAANSDSGGGDDDDAPSTLESRQAQAYDNFKKVRDAEAAKKLREEKAAAVRRAREKAQRFALMEGKGLGDDNDGEEQDAKAWLLGQRKRQKKIDKARKLEQELAAAEAAEAAAIQYTSKDLAGLKVAHDTTSFLDGDEQILTLKDATIEENEKEGDELENMKMRDQEKLNERLDLKKKMRGYDPNDYEDSGLLAQYDEEINGKKAKKFTLDDDGAIAELGDILGRPARKTNKLQTISLDDIIDDTVPSSDYLAALEIKVKKPKKKKNKNSRQKQADEDDIFPLEPVSADNGAMDVDSKDGPAAKKRRLETDTLADDEDLQASLARQRKNALTKRRKMRPEDLAKQLKEEGDEPTKLSDDANEGGLVIGEISEFVAGLSKHDDDEDGRPKRQKQRTQSPGAAADGDHDMGDDNKNDEDGDGDGGDDDDMRDADADAEHRQASPSIKQEQEGAEAEKDEDEEKEVGQGMGATLALLRERGLVEQADGAGQFKSFRDREEFLRRKRVLEEELDEQTRQQRERDRANGKLDRMSVREREEWARQQNTWRDHQQSKRMAELFQAGYRPSVELKYVDDHGRLLDQKEAFKHLSHQFHGKGSGKGKTEKRLKKIEDEKRREAQSLFDGQNAGMNLATAQQLKKRKEAGVRLG